VRTTLTLDDDVAAILKRLVRSRHARMKDVVNEALRRGLAGAAAPPPPREAFHTTEVSLGRCRVGAIDNVADVLAAADGESFR
jgi:hypothetical protein